MRKMVLAFFLVLALALPSWAVGTFPTNQFGYKPQLTTQGTTDYANFNTGIDNIDTRLGRVVYAGDPNYATFAAAVTAIGATPATLFLPPGVHAGAGVTTPATLTVVALQGATISGAPTFNGYFQADASVHFTGSPSFANKSIIINQAWFGTTDAALQLAAASAVAGNVWYLPNGTYTQTTKISLANGVWMRGESMAYTIISSAVTGDVAIDCLNSDPTGAGGNFFVTRLSNFTLSGNGTSTTASAGTGGIWLHYVKNGRIDRVWVENFISQGWNTIGTPSSAGTIADGEMRYGIRVDGTVGTVVENCLMYHCDVGGLVDNGGITYNTTTKFNNCLFRYNRTHGFKGLKTLTTVIEGGYFEGNGGAITCLFDSGSAPGEQGNTLKNVHFEANCLLSGAGVSGSRNLNVVGDTFSSFVVDNCYFSSASATYPEINIEFAGTRGAVVLGGLHQSGTLASYGIKINSTCKYTLISGGYWTGNILDLSTTSQVNVQGAQVCGYANYANFTNPLNVWKGNFLVGNPATLSAENLTNPNLTGGASWSATNDCTLASDAATWAYAAGTASNLVQATGDLAVATKGNRWYVFTYTLSAKTLAPQLTITTAFAAATVYLDMNVGTNTVYFQAKSSPGNFTIAGTMTTGMAVTMDSLSLKEVQGGNAQVLGKYTGGGTSGMSIDGTGVATFDTTLQGTVGSFSTAVRGSALEVPNLIKKAASANVRNSHNAAASSTATSYTKAKTIILTNGLLGVQRFLFDLKTAGGGATAYGKIYRNGVALGAEQTDVTGGFVTKSQDITQNWNPGDTCELWIYTSDAGQAASVQNFQIAYDDSPTVTVASSNTTP